VTQHPYRRWVLSLGGAALATLLGLSCDESLPPREGPPEVLSSVLSVINDGKIVVVRGGLPAGTMGAIQINVTNVYDDVLQDSCVLEGRVEFWLKKDPSVRAEFLLTEADLVTYNLVDRTTLTIGVDTTLIMLHQWSHRTVDGVPLWEYLHLYPSATPRGEPCCISSPTPFIVRCSLRVFKSYGQIQFPDREVVLTYQVFGIECSPPD
jgi:hypothetical protein